MGQLERVTPPDMFEQMGGLRYRELLWFAQGKKASGRAKIKIQGIRSAKD